MKLNPEQKEAVQHYKGPLIVTAVPGSGKTATLTNRVIYLIKHYGVDPKNICCLTFTNKAANEMRERISHALGEEIASKIWISTFHSYCLAILRKYGEHVKLRKSFSVYDDKDQIELITKIARMHEYECQAWVIKQMGSVINDLRENLCSMKDAGVLLGVGKNRDADTEKAILKEYVQSLDEFNAVDFSGILYKTYLLLYKKAPKTAEILANRHQYILVDEVQDTNNIQYEIVKKIASHNNLFVVGDIQQSIFSWRGAKPENIELIERDFENTKRIVLPRNYRSTAKILEHAERLIRHNDNASDVNLISERGDGHAPIVRQFQSPEYESESIANAIQNYRCEGYKYGDMAVIYRTNQLSKSQELALRDKNIPYKMIGGFSFFDRKEIKTSLSYLSILANPKDTISFARAIAEPKRGVGPTNVGKLESFCKANDMDIIEACKHIDHMPGINKKAKSELKSFAAVVEKYQGQHADGRCIGEISNAFLRESGFYPYIEEESFKDDSSKKRLDNVNEFLLSVAEFSDSRKNAKFSDFLQTVKTFKETEQDDEDAVTLLTMHASKGLQFPIVFIIGVERDIIPHSRSVQENGENEERRLMYVAVTRAQDHLILSHCRMRPKNSFGHVKYSRSGPSPFLFELFEDLNVV